MDDNIRLVLADIYECIEEVSKKVRDVGGVELESLISTEFYCRDRAKALRSGSYPPETSNVREPGEEG